MIGISLLTLVPGRVGGSETYVRELLRALARTGRLDYRVFLSRLAPDAAAGLPARVVTSYPVAASTTRRALAMAFAALSPARLRREFGSEHLAAVHFPLTNVLPRLDLPTAVTVHDLYHELFSGLPRSEVTWRRMTWRRAFARARLLIAISEAVKQTLIELYGIDAERIRVVHLGVDHSRFRPGTEPRQPILLFPAHHWPNKNHARLLEAFAVLRRRHPELRLVLTGHGHARLPASPGVERRGYVSRDELVRLYQTAQALVFPSFYEGFGQPPLEAMASGCAVAAAEAGAIPEICGDAVRLFDPFSIESIVEGVEDVLARRDEYAARGLERAARFSWELCAQRHEAVYAELAA